MDIRVELPPILNELQNYNWIKWISNEKQRVLDLSNAELFLIFYFIIIGLPSHIFIHYFYINTLKETL